MQQTRHGQNGASLLILVFDEHHVEGTMDGTLIARWTYVTAGLLCTAVFWFYGGARWTRGEFPIMDNLPLFYEILPFAVLALVLAATRRRRLAPPALELVTALLWLAMFLGFALWDPMWTSVERIGSGVIDGLAAVVGLTAVSMCVLAVQALLPKGAQPASAPERLLHSAGIGILGFYLARVSLLLWGSTRMTFSGGIAALVYEARLRMVVCAVVALLLAASALVARRTRGAWAS